MRKFFLILILISNIAVAQNSKKKDLVKKLTETTCNCTTKSKVAPAKVKVTLGLCLLEAITTNKTEVFKIYGKKSLNKELIEEVGEDIGSEMMDICPETMEVLFNDKEFINEIIEGNDENNSSDEDENLKISGVFTQTKVEGYLYVVVKENSGKINEFVILQNFENVFLITDKVLKPNDSVTVSYYEAELFDSKLNKFITLKVATDIVK